MFVRVFFLESLMKSVEVGGVKIEGRVILTN